jgi:hypothetical protein
MPAAFRSCGDDDHQPLWSISAARRGSSLASNRHAVEGYQSAYRSKRARCHQRSRAIHPGPRARHFKRRRQSTRLRQKRRFTAHNSNCRELMALTTVGVTQGLQSATQASNLPQNWGCKEVGAFPCEPQSRRRSGRTTWPRESPNPRSRQDQRSFSTLRRVTAAGRSASRAIRISTSAARRSLTVVPTASCIGAWRSSRRGPAISPPPQFHPRPPRPRRPLGTRA